MKAEEFDSHFDELAEPDDNVVLIDEQDGTLYEVVDLRREADTPSGTIFIKVREL
jgi:hypothetical protein